MKSYLVLCIITLSLGGLRAESAVQPRLEINELLADEKMGNLFLQAYNAMQEAPVDDYYSFYQIASIHGMPFELLYRGVENPEYPASEVIADYNSTSDSGWWPGYCHHTSTLFPVWHRAYMLLIETALQNKSRIIAGQYADEDVRNEYLQLAEDLRMPYWNWAADSVQKSGVPEILTNKTVTVYAPPDNEPKIISNPLEGFTTPEPVGSPQPCPTCNPYDRPFSMTSEAGYPWLPKGFSTARYPSVDNQTQVNFLNKGVRAESLIDWQEMLYQTLLQGNWTYFSNHGALPNGTIAETGYTFNNIESTHDSVHVGIGQSGGQMAYTQIAAYDPIFFLHHGMVEYILSVWQEMYPDEWVTPNVLPTGTLTIKPGTVVDENTPLTPFFSGDGAASNPFYTANDLRNIKDLGYTYRSLEDVKDLPQKLKKAALLKLFKPAGDDIQYRWYVALPNATVEDAPASLSVRVFVAAPYTVNATEPVTSQYYAGSIAVWGAPPITRKLNRQSVDVTTNMEDQNIATTVFPSTVDGTFNTSSNPLMDAGSSLKPSDLQFTAVSTNGEDFSEYVSNLDQPLIYYQMIGDNSEVITKETYPESRNLGSAATSVETSTTLPSSGTATLPEPSVSSAISPGQSSLMALCILSSYLLQVFL